jgi:glycosyltransferase involved in cell wall biosynthesis
MLKCIETQNSPCYRYIFVDAGSTDGTKEFLIEKYANVPNGDSIVILNPKSKRWALNEAWQQAMPHLKAPYFCMCDDDVLVYGKEFLTRLVDKLKEGEYGVIAPRSPNIRRHSFNKFRRKGNAMDCGLLGSHFRMCDAKKAIPALGGWFGPTRKETWFMGQMNKAGIRMGFLLDLIVFDMGHWAGGGYAGHNLHIDHVIEWGENFLKTGWFYKYPEEAKLGIVEGIY